MKPCSHCGDHKPLGDFYRNCRTTDGRGSWCISCEKGRDRRSYAKSRRHHPAVLASVRKYRESAHGKAMVAAYGRRARRERPEETRARDALNGAVRCGRIKRPKRCEHCRKTGIIQAHHDDYSRPLEVAWLCPPCHVKVHSK